MRISRLATGPESTSHFLTKVSLDCDGLRPRAVEARRLSRSRFGRILRHRAEAALDESEEIKRRIAQLEVEHRDLDAAIEALAAQAGHDQLLTARLKKRKLLLRDEIAELVDQIVPDIIA